MSKADAFVWVRFGYDLGQKETDYTLKKEMLQVTNVQFKQAEPEHQLTNVVFSTFSSYAKVRILETGYDIP